METVDQYLSAVLEKLKSDGNVAIIYAGNPNDAGTVQFKSHNPRHWKSYRSVAEDIQNALKLLGFRNLFLLEESMRLPARLKNLKIDFAWLNTAGVQGVDSSCHCAALLESLGIGYVGHTPANVALMDNKHLFKIHLLSQGVRTAPYMVWRPEDDVRSNLNSTLDRFIQELKEDEQFEDSTKFVVKPVCGRASNHIFIADSIEEARELSRRVFTETGNTVLIEPFLSGKEFCISVMGGRSGVRDNERGWEFKQDSYACCFGQFERRLEDPNGIFTSMDIRPIGRDTIKVLSESSESAVLGNINTIARTIFRNLGIYSVIRIDLRMNKSGHLYVLEANPKPDLRAPSDEATSLVSMGLGQLGISYEQMILNQIINTLAHFHLYRKSIAYRLLTLDRSTCSLAVGKN